MTIITANQPPTLRSVMSGGLVWKSITFIVSTYSCEPRWRKMINSSKLYKTQHISYLYRHQLAIHRTEYRSIVVWIHRSDASRWHVKTMAGIVQACSRRWCTNNHQRGPLCMPMGGRVSRGVKEAEQGSKESDDSLAPLPLPRHAVLRIDTHTLSRGIKRSHRGKLPAAKIR